MAQKLIQPRTLKGFRDFLPAAMIPRERLMETARQVYRSYGFVPIDTPALEYSDVLCGKGGEESDRQMFRFEDHGGRDVGMRFDLTIPLARFVAQHSNELGMPFKRYHVASVWRGEKPQVGRYREFVQCDFDTIGTTSAASDIETALVIFDLMQAIGFERFNIRINNRMILNGLLQEFDLSSHSVAILRALDKLPKNGRDAVQSEMTETSGASASQVAKILELAEISGSNQEILKQLDPVCAQNELAREGQERLAEIIRAADAIGVGGEHLSIDISIARGLDYYTGTIYETFLGDLPGIGSVCSGGRYDNLAEVFTKQQLPGVGASLGLDRLLAAMESLGLVPQTRTTADVLIVQFDQQRLHNYLQIASAIRQAGIGVEVFADTKKLAQQFKYADRRGFRAVIVAGADEFDNGVVQIKWMSDGSQQEVPCGDDADQVVSRLKERLQGGT